ncbi:MAG: hypothetical protein NT062_24020 [Proteobacteria bacterium]|nr:hypothetical protein [Pseudomonadota bacterium]
MQRLIVSVGFLVVACDGGTKAPVVDANNPVVDAPAIDTPPDASIAPVFRNPVALPDGQLALAALQIIGADVPGAQATACNTCHGLTRASIRAWGGLSATAMTNCFTDLAVTSQASAQQMIACLRTMPAVATSDFATSKMGVYASAARLPWFAYTFKVAYGATADAELTTFQESAGMPRGPTVTPLTQEKFDIVAEWFARNLPLLDQTLAPEGQGTTCTPGISPDVQTHVTSMQTLGWRAQNRDNAMAMFGCGAAVDPRDCLAGNPLGSSMPYGSTWDVAGTGHARVLKDVTYRSYYWSRSSADGRFIAHGVENVSGSYILDLQRDVVVPIANTQYDPTFFPDNGGFMFQGGTQGARNNVCGMSVLTSNPTSVSMSEAACSRANMVGLYQHVGRALAAGGDYFAIDSEFTNDNGGHTPTHNDPPAAFDVQGYTDFTPMVFDGTKFVQHQLSHLPMPYEGDVVMSPSSELVMSRVAGQGDQQLGYVLRKITKTWNGSTYTLGEAKVGRYCVAGAKVSFSFDERFVVYHHYVTSADYAELGFATAAAPGFQAYLTSGAANIYVLDLLTGVTRRITNMAPGQYAVFPHFRSDGWIYADVRDTTTGHEYFIAHDGALILE